MGPQVFGGYRTANARMREKTNTNEHDDDVYNNGIDENDPDRLDSAGVGTIETKFDERNVKTSHASAMIGSPTPNS